MTSAGGRLAQDLAIAVGTAAVLLWPSWHALDEQVTRAFYDAAQGGFPWRNHWLFALVLHEWAKWAVVAIGVAILAAWVASYGAASLASRRRMLGYIVVAMALGPATVGVLKAGSMTHCPWDLVDFGGTAPFVPLLQSAAIGSPLGKCLPAGHAAAGFSLLAFYFAARAEGRTRHARFSLTTALALGLALGLVQIVRGAHFLTHVLWSGVVCWSVMAIVAALVWPHARGPDARSTLPA